MHYSLSLKLGFFPLTFQERRERKSGCLETWTDPKTHARSVRVLFFVFSYRGGSTWTKTSLYDARVISEVSSWWKAWRFLHINALTKCFVVYTQIPWKKRVDFTKLAIPISFPESLSDRKKINFSHRTRNNWFCGSFPKWIKNRNFSLIHFFFLKILVNILVVALFY